MDTLRKLREESLFALLSGPPGGGKTAMLEAAFAGQTGGLFIITGDAGTRTDDFIGQWNPTGKQDEIYWSDGPLILAMRSGGVLFIDDATLIDTKKSHVRILRWTDAGKSGLKHILCRKTGKCNLIS